MAKENQDLYYTTVHGMLLLQIDKMINDGHDEVMGLLEDDGEGEMKIWRIEDALSLHEIQAIFQIAGVALAVALVVMLTTCVLPIYNHIPTEQCVHFKCARFYICRFSSLKC